MKLKGYLQSVVLSVESILSYSIFHQVLYYLMSQQAVPPQSTIKRNHQQLQAQNIQQHNPSFEAGKAIFEMLDKKSVETFENFRKLHTTEMKVIINDFQYWMDTGGPQSKEEIYLSKLFLSSLKNIKQDESTRNKPALVQKIDDWFDYLIGSQSSLKLILDKKKSNIANVGLNSSSQASGKSHNLLENGKIHGYQEQKKPLKWS